MSKNWGAVTLEKRAAWCAAISASKRGKPQNRETKFAKCHPERKHLALGFCSPCYYSQNFQKRYEENPTKFKERNRNALKNLRQEWLEAYGGKCSCCGEGEPEFLTIEHVEHDGKKHRQSLGYNGLQVLRDLKKQGWLRDRYDILCTNCNFATRLGGIYPHRRL